MEIVGDNGNLSHSISHSLPLRLCSCINVYIHTRTRSLSFSRSLIHSLTHSHTDRQTWRCMHTRHMHQCTHTHTLSLYFPLLCLSPFSVASSLWRSIMLCLAVDKLMRLVNLRDTMFLYNLSLCNYDLCHSFYSPPPNPACGAQPNNFYNYILNS